MIAHGPPTPHGLAFRPRDYISSTIPLLWPSPSLLSFRFDIHRNLRSLSFDHCFVPAVTVSVKRLKLVLYKRVRSLLLSFILTTSLIALEPIFRVVDKPDFQGFRKWSDIRSLRRPRQLNTYLWRSASP